MKRTPSILLALLLTAAFGAPAQSQTATRITYHVATTGSDANPGTLSAPFKRVQSAVDAARTGDLILVHAGTYDGVVEIKKNSGAPGRPIVLRAAGDGEVVLRASFSKPSCLAGSATRERTIQILGGVDWWVIRDLTIVNGIFVAGLNSSVLDRAVYDRSLPGRGTNDKVAAANALPLLGVNPSDHIKIKRNKITLRGIQLVASRWARVIENEVSYMECGTGVGIGLSRFSDFGTVRGNFVHHGTHSGENVGMEDGIRLSGAANYNLIENNLVEDMVGRGRGFSTDVLASWNKFSRNTARRTIIGFNEEHGGWGNEWSNNRAVDVEQTAFKVDSKDNGQVTPVDGTPAYIKFTSNCSVNNGSDLGIGSIQTSTFHDNSFTKLALGKNLQSYWTSAGNVYNGSTAVPTTGGVAKSWCS